MPKLVKRIYRSIVAFSISVGRLNITAYAACIAYFFMLSLVPMVILLCSILPFTRISEELLVQYFQEMTPDFFHNVIERLVSSVYRGGYAALTISILATLWSAGKGISALIQGINVVNAMEEKRNFIHKRIVCCVYTIFMLAAVLVSLVIMVFGRYISDYLSNVWSGFHKIQGVLVRPRYLYMFLILTAVFSLCYAYLPNKHLKFREQVPGAMFAAVCWIGFSFFFSLYVNKFNPYNIYGSLGIFIIAMVWFYFCMLFLLYGACINRYYRPITLKMVHPIQNIREKKKRVLAEKNRENDVTNIIADTVHTNADAESDIDEMIADVTCVGVVTDSETTDDTGDNQKDNRYLNNK